MRRQGFRVILIYLVNYILRNFYIFIPASPGLVFVLCYSVSHSTQVTCTLFFGCARTLYCPRWWSVPWCGTITARPALCGSLGVMTPAPRLPPPSASLDDDPMCSGSWHCCCKGCGSRLCVKYPPPTCFVVAFICYLVVIGCCIISCVLCCGAGE